jgi:hypothetical protein
MCPLQRFPTQFMETILPARDLLYIDTASAAGIILANVWNDQE